MDSYLFGEVSDMLMMEKTRRLLKICCYLEELEDYKCKDVVYLKEIDFP